MMKRRFLLKFILLIVAIYGFTNRKATAQVDAHFSQYYAYPLWLNPGLTGVIGGDFQMTANYKRQWASIADPYSTIALSFDTYPVNHLSWGATILNQSAGNAGYNYLNVLASAAYSARLDDNGNILSIGIQAGVINRRFDPGKMRSGEQWNPVLGYDPDAPLGEVFNKTTALDLDANVGIVYYNSDPDARINPFAGVSLYHLPHPHDPFYTNSKERLPVRLNIHGGLKIKLNPQFNLTPHILYLRQGNAYEMAGSMYVQYILSNMSDFIFGATYRLRDAVVPFVGFHIGDFTWGLSDDVNVSRLKSASSGNGGLELSLSYTRHKDLQKLQLTCPRF